MKRISSSYVYYYNHKYGRIGHLFQERFKSQPVSEWEYFLTLLRYIHQNPLKPKLVSNLKDYEWSSWPEYIGVQTDRLCATQVVLSRISLQDLAQLIGQPMTDEEENGLLDIEDTPVKTNFTDSEIWEILTCICGVGNLSDFQKLPRPEQNHVLWEAHERGIGPRSLSRLTGVTYSIVQRATSAENERRMKPSITDTLSDDDDSAAYCVCDDFEPYPDY